MGAWKNQEISDIFASQEESHETALNYHLNRNGKIMDDKKLKVAYHDAEGRPIYTSNPEVIKHPNKAAVWSENDDKTIQLMLDDFERYFDDLKKAYNNLKIGQPKDRKLLLELKLAHTFWNDLRNELISRVAFCNKSRLNLPPSLDDPQAARREELETNAYLENRERGIK